MFDLVGRTFGGVLVLSRRGIIVDPGNMLTTALISFREFFEAFLIIGLFLGISKQFGLKKEVEILLAAGIGIIISFLLAVGTYLSGDSIKMFFPDSSIELLEGYLLLFSAVFIAYVVFSLHKTLGKAHKEAVERAKQKMSEQAFDIALFLTIITLIVREGLEIALFTASVSLFADFVTNMTGLFAGFFGASILGVVVYLAYTKFSIKKIFTLTEYAILALGAVMFAGGVTKVAEGQLGVLVSEFLKVPIPFLTDGISVVPAVPALVYMWVVYLLFMKKTKSREN